MIEGSRCDGDVMELKDMCRSVLDACETSYPNLYAFVLYIGDFLLS